MRDAAVAAARAAGTHALRNEHRRHEVDARFPHDIKLRLDRECQDRAEDVLLERFPGDPILGEEGERGGGSGERLWIIDPIDGTVNFLHGLPFWCSSVAFRHGGEVVAGAVYLPAFDACYLATSDQPATCNGEPIQVSMVDHLGDSLVLTGVSKHGSDEKALKRLQDFVPKVQKVRVMGSAAADMCMVAAGRADGYYETSIYLWDWAAAGLIVQQAGGTVEVLERGRNHAGRIMCTNGLIHEDLKKIVSFW